MIWWASFLIENQCKGVRVDWEKKIEELSRKKTEKTELILSTKIKRKSGKLYFIDLDGGLYETTMGPRIPGYKGELKATFEIKREKGYLYFADENKEGFIDICRVEWEEK